MLNHRESTSWLWSSEKKTDAVRDTWWSAAKPLQMLLGYRWKDRFKKIQEENKLKNEETLGRPVHPGLGLEWRKDRRWKNQCSAVDIVDTACRKMNLSQPTDTAGADASSMKPKNSNHVGW